MHFHSRQLPVGLCNIRNQDAHIFPISLMSRRAVLAITVRLRNASVSMTPADISGETDADCQDGYFSRMGICTPSDDRYNGCGSVSLNHLWNGYTFLTVSSDIRGPPQARNVLSPYIAVSVQLRSARLLMRRYEVSAEECLATCAFCVGTS